MPQPRTVLEEIRIAGGVATYRTDATSDDVITALAERAPELEANGILIAICECRGTTGVRRVLVIASIVESIRLDTIFTIQVVRGDHREAMPMDRFVIIPTTAGPTAAELSAFFADNLRMRARN